MSKWNLERRLARTQPMSVSHPDFPEELVDLTTRTAFSRETYAATKSAMSRMVAASMMLHPKDYETRLADVRTRIPLFDAIMSRFPRDVPLWFDDWEPIDDFGPDVKLLAYDGESVSMGHFGGLSYEGRVGAQHIAQAGYTMQLCWCLHPSVSVPRVKFFRMDLCVRVGSLPNPDVVWCVTREYTVRAVVIKNSQTVRASCTVLIHDENPLVVDGKLIPSLVSSYVSIHATYLEAYLSIALAREVPLRVHKNEPSSYFFMVVGAALNEATDKYEYVPAHNWVKLPFLDEAPTFRSIPFVRPPPVDWDALASSDDEDE